NRRFLTFEAELIGMVSHSQTANITDVLTQAVATIYKVTFNRLISTVLGSQTISFSFKSGTVSICPPVALNTLGIRLRPLVIETVTHFMANHCTYGAVVYCRVSIRIEERCLQNRGREYDF